MPRLRPEARTRRLEVAPWSKETERFLLRGTDYFHTFAKSPELALATWQAYRGEILARWLAERPGSRPAAWWVHDAPEPVRRCVSGPGAAAFREPLDPDLAWTRKLWFGVPCMLGRDDFDRPSAYESEAAYLDRLGLLEPGERERLHPDAFDPEPMGTVRDLKVDRSEPLKPEPIRDSSNQERTTNGTVA